MSSTSLDKFFKTNKRKLVSTITSATIKAKQDQKVKRCSEAKTVQKKISKMNEEELTIYLDETSKEEIKEMLQCMDEIYFNMTSEEANEYCVSDALYDKIKMFYENKYDCEYNSVGALPRSGGNDRIKIRLPQWAPSLKKAQNEATFKSRRNKLVAVNAQKTCLADKVDGEAAQLFCRQPSTSYFLTTRGGGKVGMDICHLLQYIQHKLPPIEKLQKAGISSVRCELVLKRKDFEHIKAHPPVGLSASNKLTNARNVLVGQINAKGSGLAEILSLTSVIAYEIKYENPLLHPNRFSPFAQMQELKALGFEIPQPTLQNIDYTYKEACQILLSREEKAEYEMDGLVESAECYDEKLDTFDDGGFRGMPIAVSDEEAKNLSIKDCELPELMFAIKLSSAHMKLRAKQSTVIKNVWQVSRYGRLTPVVWIVPIVIDGKTIGHPTGKSAKLMKDEKCGPGSLVSVVFGGGVIADIVSFDSPSTSGEAQFPTKYDYFWTETGEHIYLRDPESSEEVKIQRMQFFFAELEGDSLGDETVALLCKLYEGDLKRILRCTSEELLKLPGFQIKRATNVSTSIQNCIAKVHLVKLMFASCLFGESLGPSRLQDIFDSFPDVMEWEVKPNLKHLLVEKLQTIRGLKKLAIQFVENLPRFQEFVKTHSMIKIIELSPEFEEEQKTNKRQALHIGLYPLPKLVVFTGFSDNMWELKIKANGGKVQSGVNKHTEICVTKVRGSGSKKEETAQELGVPILSMADFKKKYEL
jgi:NAD-dependent DNA ligase